MKQQFLHIDALSKKIRMNLRFLLCLFISFSIFSAFGKANNPPTFVGGANQQLSICQNATISVIDSLLQTQDIDLSQTLTYNISSPPAHGTLHGFPGSGSSNGSVFSPSGFSYTPTTGYSGTDVFVITVSDGTATAQTTVSVTINALPSITANTGGNSVCVGLTRTLKNTTSGGVWSSSNDLVASVISNTGVVTGEAAGTSIISYTVVNANGCSNTATTNFTVSGFPNVQAITGTGNLCVGATTVLADATTGGVWSSANNTIATVSASGVVTGVASGTVNILYTVTNAYGCASSVTKSVAVNASPTVNAITASTTAICIGSTTIFTNATNGGVWSSSNSAIATVSVNGRVTGISAGSDTIYYTVTNGTTGCSTSSFVGITVSNPPTIAAITGTNSICVNNTTTLSCSTTGGTWSSNNTTVATVNNSGVVTGLRAGTANILYTVIGTGGCSRNAVLSVTVSNLPTVAAITGTNSICTGSTTTLTNTTAGGTWTTSNAAIATVSTAGLVSGISVGTDTIYYTVKSGANCSATASFVINVSTGITVSALVGPASVCLGSTVTLTNSTTGGTWSATPAGVVNVNASGVVTGLTPGVATVKYTIGSGSCTGYAEKNIIVSDIPSLGSNITTTTTVCTTDTILITNATTGGTWSSNIPAFATVDQNGYVAGVRAGNVTITYTVTNAYGCSQSASTNLTVANKPNNFTISGSNSTCIGNIISLTTSVTGGTWASLNTAIATVVNGIVIGKAAGKDSISYTVSNGTGCVRTNYKIVTIDTALVVSPIVGNTNICIGTNSQFTDATVLSSGSTGTWSSSDNTVATVNTTGLVTPIKAGTTTLTYFVDNGSGCSGSATKTIVVNNRPTVGTISGPNSICSGDSTTLTNTVTGGTWTSGNPNSLSVDATTGVAKGLVVFGGGGTVNVTVGYQVTSAQGCVSPFATKTIAVNVGPNLSTQTTGTNTVCVGSTTTYANNTAGGVWSTSNPAIATVNASTGVVRGVAQGTAVVLYTITNATGCASVANRNVNVSASPVVVATTGVNTVCVGATSQLSNTSSLAGGSTAAWSSSNTAIATVDVNTGKVTGISAGTATIYYTVTARQIGPTAPCSSVASTTFTVNPIPTVGVIKSTATTVCVGSTISFTDTTSGGTWVVNDSNIASVDASGTITGKTPGAVIVTYSVTKNGCTSTVFSNATVAALPVVSAISGVDSICVGATTQLSHSSTLGSWSSVYTNLATVDANGLVTAVASGVDTIVYSITNGSGCVGKATFAVRINDLPSTPTINSVNAICDGTSTTFSSTTTGGVWSNANTNVATIDAAGLVNAVNVGVDTISYTVTNSFGCTNTAKKALSVSAIPIVSFSVNDSAQCLNGNYFVFTNGTTIASGSLTYSWTIDNKQSTTVSPTNVFATAGTYDVKLLAIGNGGCIDSLTKQVVIHPNPSAAFTINNATQCLNGNNYAFTNGSTISSGTNSYKWSFGDATLDNVTDAAHTYSKAGTFTVVLTATSNQGCIDSTTNTVTLTPSVTPSITISTSSSNVCFGAAVSFTAATVNGGITPTYQWTKNGVNVGTNAATYSDNALTATDKIACILTSSVACVTATTASSNNISVNVTNFVTPSVSISASATSVCAGTSVAFTAAGNNNGATPTYTWKVNGVSTGITGSTYSTSTLSDGDLVTCDLNSSLACVTAKTVTSNTVAITVKAATSSTTKASICQGSVYTFNGNNYSTAGTYSFKTTNAVGCDSTATLILTVNAKTSSTTNATICGGASYTFNGKSYSIAGSYTDTLSNATGCDSLATLVLTVTTPLTPSVSITASATSINSGTSVIFTANPVNGGVSPVYQWTKNGVPIAGAIAVTYTTTTLNDKDTIACVITTSLGCVTANTVTSNLVIMSVTTEFTIAGSIKSPLGYAVPVATVSLNGGTSTTTDAAGNYSFKVTSGTSNVIVPSKNNDSIKANGISVIDVLQIQGAILNKFTFNSPYKVIAADVDKSGSVSVLDILYLKRLILGIDKSFIGNRLWAFVDSSISETTVTIPYKDSIVISSIGSDKKSQSFIGIKLGDVNYDWNPTLTPFGSISKITKPIEIYFNDVPATESNQVRIPIRVKNFKNIIGMQYTLHFNANQLQLVGIDKNTLDMEYSVGKASEGKISFLWADSKNEAKTLSDGSQVFELVFNKKSPITNDAINVSSELIQVEAWDADFNKVGIVKTSGKLLNTVEFATTDNWNITPNPTIDGKLTIAINVAEPKKVSFDVTNTHGKVVLHFEKYVLSGTNTLQFNLQSNANLPAGQYYITASGIANARTKPVLLVK